MLKNTFDTKTTFISERNCMTIKYLVLVLTMGLTIHQVVAMEAVSHVAIPLPITLLALD